MNLIDHAGVRLAQVARDVRGTVVPAPPQKIKQNFSHRIHL